MGNNLISAFDQDTSCISEWLLGAVAEPLKGSSSLQPEMRVQQPNQGTHLCRLALLRVPKTPTQDMACPSQHYVPYEHSA